MKLRTSSPWMLVTVALFTAAAAQRAWNLVHYPASMGFDAHGNWEYIASLLARWHLPAPDAGWSTAHPPLFYALAAAIGRLMGSSQMEPVSRATIAVCGLLGLAAVAAVAALVRQRNAGGDRRMAIAAALVLFLPVHIYTGAMLGEEMLATALVSFAVVGLARELGRPPAERSDLRRPALLGVLAGLGLLTKMSAVLPIGAAVMVLLAEGPVRGWKRALVSTLAFGTPAALVGGWFYVYNLATYGYLYPHALAVHSLMFDMPPGSRSAIDYLRIPLVAFGPVQSSDPALVHSVWGSLWATIWFDSHRAFVPLHPTTGLQAAAHILLVLGLVPAFAFAVGLARGLRRALREASGPDRLLVAVSVFLLAGFVAFTWRNPWFASIKGSYLLALSVPYAVYASEVLQDWSRSRRWCAWTLAAVLGLTSTVSLVTFSYNARFQKHEYPGTEWRATPP